MSKTPYELFGDEGILNSGWGSLVKPLIEECKEKGVRILQIKEKFGGLRFYVDACDEALRNRIDEAERRSYEICMKCGNKGKLRDDLPWILTLCEKHYIETQK